MKPVRHLKNASAAGMFLLLRHLGLRLTSLQQLFYRRHCHWFTERSSITSKV